MVLWVIRTDPGCNPPGHVKLAVMTYLWCLPGNLQTPKVWADLRARVASPDLDVVSYDVRTSSETFWAWAEVFCSEVAQKKGRHLLLGYSLGGRLALHALLHAPELWAGALVVGADTGLADKQAKEARVRWDAAWAERFLNEPWEDVLHDWDAQAVFGGRSNKAARAPEDFSPEEVARLFTLFSKGRQDDLLPRLRTLTAPPVWYVAGEEDIRYSKLGQQLAAQCPAVSFVSVPNAAHRVPWEAPQDFAELVRNFVQQTAPESPRA